jgi:hypothetical protein
LVKDLLDQQAKIMPASEGSAGAGTAAVVPEAQ